MRGVGGWLVLTVVAALALASCSDRPGNAQTKAPAAPPVPVEATTVEQKLVPLQVTAVGNVQASMTVAVKSLVVGQIVRVHFTEGQDVQHDQLLFTIDPRPFEAALRQAEATVAKDRAQLRQTEAAVGQRQAEITQALANLERDLAQLEMAGMQQQRYRTLAEQGLIAREQYDQVQTAWSAITATVQADRAAVENARAATRAAEAMVDNARAAITANKAAVETTRLQIGYTTIRAPMAGRTGNLLVQAGNLVKVNDDNPLVVIAQVRPVHVSFGVPERHLAAIRQYRAAGSLKAEVAVDGGKRTAVGAVTFMNNVVDTTTGTIQLKATFPNADSALWPGQFVDTALTLTTEQAVVVPSRAVQAGQKGPFIFVVKPDQTVEARPVKVGRRLAAEVVIDEGVRPGERIVTEGQLRLVPGSRVDVKAARTS